MRGRGGAVAVFVVSLALVLGALSVGQWTAAVESSRPGNSKSCHGVPAPDIIALEFAGSVERAGSLLPDACSRVLAREMVRRDSLFILVYVSVLGFFCLWGANHFRSQKMRVAGTVAFAAAILVGALDVVENIFLGGLAGDFLVPADPEMASRVTMATIPKWALVAVVVGYALGALVSMALRIRRPPALVPAPGIDEDTVWAADHLRVAQARGRSPRADVQDERARWWWAARPPFVTGWHPADGPEDTSAMPLGIAMSGGGIRSASFNLGCLQTCLDADVPGAEPGTKVVRSARYLAAVSGGGYLAAGRQMALHQGVADPFRDPSSEQSHLLGGARYLWSTRMERVLGLGRLVSAVFFNVGLLLSFLYVITRLVGWAASGTSLFRPDGSGFTLLAEDIGVLAWPTAGLVAMAAGAFMGRGLPSVVGSVFRAVTALAGAAAALATLWLSLLAPWFVGVGTVAVLGLALLVALRWRSGDWALSRKSATGVVLAIIATGVGLGWLRGGARHGWEGTAEAGDGSLWVLLAAVFLTVVAGLFVRVVLETCAPRPSWKLLLVGVALLTAAGLALVGCALQDRWWDLPFSEWVWGAIVGGALLLVFVGLDQGWWSPHKFYKRRLAGAFAHPSRHETTTFSTWGAPVDGQPALLTCAAVHLPGHEYGTRTVGSFTFAHDLTGGPDVGWVPTTDFEACLWGARQKEDGTVQAAMAISGAAVASANGYMDLGSNNSALAILNARLGVWLPNPTHVHEIVGRRRAPEHGVGPADERRPSRSRIRRVNYLFKEVFGVYDPLDRFVYVSDGGHHDNLALIELLRRRCGVILCFDASGDKKGTATTFAEVRDRATGELGVTFTPIVDAEAKGVGDGTKRVATYRITYPDLAPPPEAEGGRHLHAADGLLVFAKCRVFESDPDDGEDVDIGAPKGEDRGKWPHDGTGNQWFSPARVEAYRDLGRTVAAEAIGAWGRDRTAVGGGAAGA